MTKGIAVVGNSVGAKRRKAPAENSEGGPLSGPSAGIGRPALVLTAEDFGQAVRDRRRALRLTQDEIALDAGITRQRLGELERGKSGIHLEVALRVCRSLGLKVRLGEILP